MNLDQRFGAQRMLWHVVHSLEDDGQYIHGEAVKRLGMALLRDDDDEGDVFPAAADLPDASTVATERLVKRKELEAV